jgi:hypothetical protein
MKRARTTLVRLDQQEPEPIRRIARQGPTAVMRLRWRDPDDNSPLARSAREIDGHRAYCPLRYMQLRHGDRSDITERHIYAADRLRRAYDLAVIGASGPRDMVPVLSIVYGPCSGFSVAATAQPKALREVQRAMALFNGEERALLTKVVLFNYSVLAWCLIRRQHGLPGNREAETARLVRCLGRLEQHYAAEIDEDLAKGRLLAA